MVGGSSPSGGINGGGRKVTTFYLLALNKQREENLLIIKTRPQKKKFALTFDLNILDSNISPTSRPLQRNHHSRQDVIVIRAALAAGWHVISQGYGKFVAGRGGRVFTQWQITFRNLQAVK